MTTFRVAVLALALASLAPPARAGVVINEVLYHPPDDRDDLQFVELHNTGDQAVNLSGWRLKGAVYTFPAGSSIAAGGYVVVGKDPKAFKTHFGTDAVGPFQGRLSHGGELIELVDAAGKMVDRVKYRTRAPWPVAPDGYGASLERICPTAAGDDPENWAPSPPRGGPEWAAGTPGRKNTNYSPRPLPVVTSVTPTPAHPAPNQELRVEAVVRPADGITSVELRYRIASPGRESAETTITMTKGAEGRYSATIPGQAAGKLIRFRVRAVDAAGGTRFFPHPDDLRPALTAYAHDKFTPGKIPLGFVINPSRAAPSPTARGRSAFVYVDPKTAEPRVFDFVSVPPRSGGFKVRFHRDRPLGDMTTINLVYEHPDRSVLAEPLAYEVYRRAGLAAPRTDHVRTWVDGQPLGFLLLIEQPNKSFLRHNGLDPGGNMYKAVWFGGDVVARHEKKTRTHEGHADLLKLVNRLNATKGDEQWAVIKAEFDVEQVAAHYAVRTVLSDWDGFFNNYFLYHDTGKTGRWTLYPWDQDKTWGYHDGTQGYEAFVDMPLTFGMEGDRPQGTAWWRPGGDVSKPLLANPRFRKLYLAKTKELLEKVYTPEAFGPAITALAERLEDEVRVKAESQRQDPKAAVEHFRRNVGSLREHLTKRREFLLRQPEIKTAGKFDRSELK